MARHCLNCDDALNEIVDTFTFTDVRNAHPPAEKGVYIIRVNEKGTPPQQIMASLLNIATRINWPLVNDYVFSRLNRLKRINHCDIIYIGRAGSSKKEKSNTLKGRYEELANRHTIQFPLWLLLFLNWEVEYGWLVNPHPEDFEKELKALYRHCHEGNLPALVDR